jgi:hypothetical protein
MKIKVFQQNKDSFMLRSGPSGPRLEASLTGAEAPVQKSPRGGEGQGEEVCTAPKVTGNLLPYLLLPVEEGDQLVALTPACPLA